MLVTGRAGYLEGVASRTGEFQKTFVGAFKGAWRREFCVQTLAEDDGSFALEIPSDCFEVGETVWFTAGGMNACPTPPFKPGTRLETNVKGSSIVSRCEGDVPVVQPIGVPDLLTPVGFSSTPQNNAGSDCPPDPYRGFGYKIAFDWTDSTSVSEIRGYWFRLQAAEDPNPLHQEFVPASAFTYVRCNAYLPDDQLEGWYWRVLAEDKVGNRSEWSEWGTLSFGPCRIDGVPCGEPP